MEVASARLQNETEVLRKLGLAAEAATRARIADQRSAALEVEGARVRLQNEHAARNGYGAALHWCAAALKAHM